MKDAFALAALSYLTCKLIFAVLSWFVDEKKATFHWKQTQQSYQHLLHSFVQRLRESFLSRPSALWPLIGASLLYHVLSFLLAIELLALLESIIFEIPYDAGDGLWQFLYLDPHDRLWPWWLYAIACVCGVGFDVLSAMVTWTLLKWAGQAESPTSLSRLLGFLIVDGLLVLVLLAGAVFFLSAIVSAIRQRAVDYTDIVLIITQVISVSVPTLSYCSIGLAILGIRWLPDRLRAWLFAPSSKRKPILPEFGTAVGTISALLIGALTFILS